jgi:hypothetical protein
MAHQPPALEAGLAKLDRPLKWGVQAQTDAAVAQVETHKVAVYASDMNGKPVFAGYVHEFGASVLAAQAKRVAA